MEDAMLGRQKLIDFRQLRYLTDMDLEIPMESNYRTCTDKKGFLIGVMFLLLWLSCLIYFLSGQSDIRRIFFPVDSCGNFCGIDNNIIFNVNCSGQNYIDKPYILKHECVERCPYLYDSSKGTYTCLITHLSEKEKQNKTKEEVGELKNVNNISCATDKYQKTDSKSDKVICDRSESTRSNGNSNTVMSVIFQNHRTPLWKFVIIIVVTLSLCRLLQFHSILVTVNYIFMVFYLLVHCIIMYFVSTYFHWWDALHGLFFFTDLVIVSAFQLFSVFYGELFNIIYREGTLVIEKIPRVWLFTLLVIIVQLLILSSSVIALMCVETSSPLRRISENYYEYEELSGLTKCLIVLFILSTNWMLQTVAGLQCMTIGGAAAVYYFKNDIEYTSSNVWRNFLWTIKHHVGTVAYWALFQPWIDIVKFSTNCFSLCPITALIRILDNLILKCEFFSKLALIETAIHGQSLLRSGKRAVEMIGRKEGAINGKLAVNSVWLMPQFGFFVLTALISDLTFLHIDHPWIPVLICVTVNLVIITVSFETSKIAGNALLICYNEDEAINGTSNSCGNWEDLKLFFEKAKEINNKNIKLELKKTII